MKRWLILILLLGTLITPFPVEAEEIYKLMVGDTEMNMKLGIVSIYKWNREEYLKIGKLFPIRTYTKIGEKYTINYDVAIVNIYPVTETYENNIWLEQGGLEYEIILTTKPPINTIIVPIQTSDEIEFWYQPPLTEETWNPGWIVNETHAISPDGLEIHHRPLEVIGSYAIYHKTKRNDQYTTGKIGHIFRPKIIDSNNNTTWGKLEYSNEQLKITIDSKWLETASYPITIDPTIGYTSQGGSYVQFNTYDNGRIASNYWWTASSGGVIKSISAYCSWGGIYHRLLVYWRNTQVAQPVYLKASTDNFGDTGAKWRTININDTWGNEAPSSGYYFLCVNYVGLPAWYYDSGGSNKYRASLDDVHPLNNDPPSTINSWTYSGLDSGKRFSCYVTYEEAPPPGIYMMNATTAFSTGAYGWVNATVVDYSGVANLDTVSIIANNSFSQNFTLLWNQTTGEFSEISDHDNICDMSGSIRENIDNYTDRIAFRFKLIPPVNESAFDVEVTLINDDAWNETKFYPELFTYVGIEWDPIGDIINSAFSLFGITQYMSKAINFVNQIGIHFTDSIVGLANMINLQFQIIWKVFGRILDWFTRIITAVINFGTTIHDITTGIATGTVNLWTYFNFSNIIDAVPIFIIIFWIDSVYKRGNTQGYTQVLYNDGQAMINIFAFFMGAFATVIGYIEGKISWLFQALT